MKVIKYTHGKYGLSFKQNYTEDKGIKLKRTKCPVLSGFKAKGCSEKINKKSLIRPWKT